MNRRRAALLAFAIAFGAFACKKVLGLSGEPGVYESPDGSVGTTDAEVPIPLPGDAACDANRVTDPRNCGSCGHDCRGSACQAGRCVPEVVARFTDTNAGRFAVNDGLVYAFEKRDLVRTDGQTKTTLAQLDEAAAHAGMLVDDKHVVCATYTDGLLGCPLAGTGGNAPTTIAPGIVPAVAPLPGSTERWPYVWLASERLYTYAGGGPVGFADAAVGEAICASVAANGSHAFFADYTGNAIRTIARTAGGASIIHSFRATTPCSLAASGDRLFWSDATSIWRAKVDTEGTITSAIALALDSIMPGTIVADGDHVYWDNGYFDNSAVYRCAVDGCDGKPETVLAGFGRFHHLALDGDYLYFSTASNQTAGLTIHRVVVR